MKQSKNPALPHHLLVRAVREIDCAACGEAALRALLQNALPEDIPTQLAVVTQWVFRLTGLRLFDSQLAAAGALLEGQLAELPTGEGKTLAAVAAAVCRVKQGHRVHVLVFNDYLAKRDYTDNRAIYEACEVTCGYIDQHKTPAERRTAYACDVTYVSAKEAGFDLLRDFLCTAPAAFVFPQPDCAIVDEADSILIDESKTPLVLAGAVPEVTQDSVKLDACIRGLSAGDYSVNTAEQQVWLTDSGAAELEAQLGIDLYAESSAETLAGLQSALEAHHLLQRDRDYIVRENAVQIVEPTTGRVVLHKRYPDLLHRAVEVKEQLPPVPLTKVYNSLTMQDFMLRYPERSGMTGTAASSAREFLEHYGMEVVVIPPHTPSVRIDHTDRVCATQQDMASAILAQLLVCREKGQPVLMGTQSVAESEEYSALLREKGIPHTVLNAKNDEQESLLIACAGEEGRVTISTNMAGRGVDIKLGGKSVVQAGGLYVIGVGINPGLRIDNQLRGRAGRQGDPGESRFFVCLADDALRQRITAFRLLRAQKVGGKLGQKIVRGAQKMMEGEAAQARDVLRRYTDIIEQQRKEITAWRTQLLRGERDMGWLDADNPEKSREIRETVGEDTLRLAERQLVVYYIGRHWADYLAAMETLRGGIHFMVIGHGSPLHAYVRAAVSGAADMLAQIRADVVKSMATLPITANGIDMAGAGLGGGTATWTYAVDESQGQFNRLASLTKGAREKMAGEDGFLTRWYRKIRCV